MEHEDGVTIRARIAAALYASGRPLTVEELARAAGISSKRKVITTARSLGSLFASEIDSVEVAELSGRRFVMQLKSNYNPIAKRFATKGLLPNSALRTLSYVAFFQPVSSSELALKRGSQVYKHLRLLVQMGFVSSTAEGKSKVYVTMPFFSEYFDLSPDPEVMKKQLTSITKAPALRGQVKKV